MPNDFEELREQIHDIRNFIAPVNLQIGDLERRLNADREYTDEHRHCIESKLLVALFRLNRQDAKIDDLEARLHQMSERITEIEREGQVQIPNARHHH